MLKIIIKPLYEIFRKIFRLHQMFHSNFPIFKLTSFRNPHFMLPPTLFSLSILSAHNLFHSILCISILVRVICASWRFELGWAFLSKLSYENRIRESGNDRWTSETTSHINICYANVRCQKIFLICARGLGFVPHNDDTKGKPK